MPITAAAPSPAPPAGSGQRVPRWLRFVMPAALVLVFALFEGGFRIADAIRTRPRSETWAVYDPDLGYRPNPGFQDTNAARLRDHPVTPKAGRFRIVILGDSLGYYGDSIDDTWVGRLRRQLRRSTALAPLDVLNASVRGTRTTRNDPT